MLEGRTRTYFVLRALVRFIIYIKITTNVLGFVDVILFRSGQQHVSITHLAIFSVVKTRIHT